MVQEVVIYDRWPESTLVQEALINVIYDRWPESTLIQEALINVIYDR